MFRKEDGSMGFSGWRLINNAMPNFSNDNVQNCITAKQLDDLFTYQLVLDDPKTLVAQSFVIAGITTEESYGEKTRLKLIKTGILSENSPEIDTTKIGKKFANDNAILPIAAQRRLVTLLFEWEDQLGRWKKMEAQEAELRQALEENGKEAEAFRGAYELRLQELETLKRTKPSILKSQAQAQASSSSAAGQTYPPPNEAAPAYEEQPPPAYQ